MSALRCKGSFLKSFLGWKGIGFVGVTPHWERGHHVRNSTVGVLEHNPLRRGSNRVANKDVFFLFSRNFILLKCLRMSVKI